ncbi:MAG: addiction module protein [Pirellulales bacterium]
MSTDSQSIFDATLAPPFEARAKLAERLWASLDNDATAENTADIEAAWIAEAERRMAAHSAGKISSRPAEEVFESVRREINQ